MVSAALPEAVAPRMPHESTYRTAEHPYRYAGPDSLFQKQAITVEPYGWPAIYVYLVWLSQA